MRRYFFIVALLFGYLGQPVAQRFEVKLTTTNNIPGKYKPKNVLAVWIETADGNYVNSLAVFANERLGYLVQWSGSSRGVKGDAITGATLSSHQAHSLNWNIKDFQGVDVPYGDYRLRFEVSSNASITPQRTIDFTLSEQSFVLQGVNDSYFQNIELSYSPKSSTSISQAQLNSNPIAIWYNRADKAVNLRTVFDKAHVVSVSLVNVKGQHLATVFTEKVLDGEQITSVGIGNKFTDGVYFVLVEHGNTRITRKITVH